MSRTLGIDFDNTIVCYDEVFHRLAMERRLIDGSVPRSKKLVRDLVRTLPDGETEWQKLQAEAYGPRLGEAHLFEGVAEFLISARRADARVFIISHKTERSRFGNPEVSLREAARSFMRDRGFFDEAELGLEEEAVFFEDTRGHKCRRIAALGCELFIDDLAETFADGRFPARTGKLLFDPHRVHGEIPGVFDLDSWEALRAHVFGDGC